MRMRHVGVLACGVFVGVLAAQGAGDVDGAGRKTFGPGEVYHEAVNKVMQPRNGSAEEPARIVIFHVGEKGQPPAIRAE